MENTTSKEKNKGGRPRKQIKKDAFEKLCGMMCTEEEICGFFGVTDKTLTRWCKENYDEGFSDIYKKISMDGKISLRRMQFKLAEKSATMAIFLGKQYLGQKDQQDIIISQDDDTIKEMEQYFANKKRNS